MAKRATRVVEPFWYVLFEDKTLPAGQQTRWRFRPLSQAERMDFLDQTEIVTEDGTGTRQLRFRNFAQSREIVLLTLIEVENFPAGDPVKYPDAGSRDQKSKWLEDVADTQIYELGQHVFNHSTLGIPEKN
jgi:hypothetical protein